MKRFTTLLLVFMGLGVSTLTQALEFPLLAKGNDLIGHLQFTRVQPGQDFYSIARHFDVGLYELVEANPGVNPDGPDVGTELIIPSQYVLPNVPHKGIIVNVAEMRLYYFPKGRSVVYTYPVGIGQVGWNTPIGKLHIAEKIKNPIWIVPESIMKFRAAHGDPVPKIVREGPNDPLGKFAMRLSDHRYLIHSTNEPDGVGQRSSAGCIRMFPENIASLFPMVPVGTPVNIIDQPFKIGFDHGKLLLEAHVPFKEDAAKYPQGSDYIQGVLSAYSKKHPASWSRAQANTIAQAQSGIPAVIGTSVSLGSRPAVAAATK
jgi:L,D-transpeptidase ErfK/SrfK